jgi:hypothetical protein
MKDDRGYGVDIMGAYRTPEGYTDIESIQNIDLLQKIDVTEDMHQSIINMNKNNDKTFQYIISNHKEYIYISQNIDELMKQHSEEYASIWEEYQESEKARKAIEKMSEEFKENHEHDENQTTKGMDELIMFEIVNYMGAIHKDIKELHKGIIEKNEKCWKICLYIMELQKKSGDMRKEIRDANRLFVDRGIHIHSTARKSGVGRLSVYNF